MKNTKKRQSFKLGKVARLFSKGNKTTKVDELLEDMPSFALKELETPQGSSWITKAEAREAKKNFELLILIFSSIHYFGYNQA